MQPPQQDVYVDNARLDVAPFVPPGARTVLDVGCGAGGFGVTLRRVLGPDARVVGIEAVPSQAAAAREGHGFDEVVEGYFPDALEGRTERFDAVFFNDVLEHLVDPWSVLRQVPPLLTDSGVVVAAIPSIQYAPVVLKLLRGRWDYVDQGTLDRTHLRFFTRATMVEMFRDCGYDVLSCEGANTMGRRWAASDSALLRAAARVVPIPFGDMAFVHFVVVARPRRP
ncbi:class I SAM-dependent methyltransferase [Intrasporangium flavum]|uniref:class I SAM-dependent methyltransferase n=1 Tax=Intrasporangium flavum TaxID=1428657 RepID=UPI00096EF539|nr:methyltransferase domain-containing protein [Intrasporangium flavum]